MVTKLPVAAAAIPPAVIVWLVAGEAMNVPFWDDWDLVGFLESVSTRGLRIGDLWAQHNEHRLVLPRLAMLALARASAWDVRVTMAASIVIALVTLGVLGLVIDRSLRPSAPALRPWVFLSGSLMTFSMVTWENWLWGWQVQVFMSALAATVVAWALATYGPRWPGPPLALAAAIGGALSFASGLVLLAVVPIVLALDPRNTSRRRGAALLTAAAGVAFVAIYLAGFHYPATHPGLLPALGRPLGVVTYALAYLGSPFAVGFRLLTLADATPVIALSAVWGALGLAVVAGGAAWTWRRHSADRAALVPWLALTLFATLSAAMTGFGRLGLSIDSALSSRYTTIAALFWVSVTAVTALIAARIVPGVSRRGAISLLALLAIVEVAAIAGYSISYTFGLQVAHVYRDGLRRGAECLRFHRIAPDHCLRLLYPDTAILRDRVRRVEALAIGPFAPAAGEPAFASYSIASASETAGSIDFIGTDYDDTEFVVVGWGLDPVTRGSARGVLVVVDGQVMGRAVTGVERPDVATTLRAGSRVNAGWVFRFGAFRLGPGSHAIDAYVVMDQRRIAKLAGSRVVAVAERRT